MGLPQSLPSTTPQGDILIVDDTPSNLRLLFDVLVSRGYRIRLAPNGELALRNARAAPPELILLDIAMPEINGYEVCAQLKASPELRSVPIIFLSAMNQLESIIRAFQLGGVDFITKPFQCEEVLARVHTHLEMHRLQKQLAEANHGLHTLNQQLTQEIQVRKQMEADLERLAATDPLTGTLNRRQFYREGDQELARARRYQHALSLIMLDIDHFKTINDQFGHAVGDLILQEVVKTLQQNLRPMDLISRYGGDEFVIILPETPLFEAVQTAERLCLAASHQTIQTDQGQVRLSLSMGVSEYLGVASIDQRDLDGLISSADQALYQAKARGRNQVAATQPMHSV